MTRICRLTSVRQAGNLFYSENGILLVTQSLLEILTFIFSLTGNLYNKLLKMLWFGHFFCQILNSKNFEVFVWRIATNTDLGMRHFRRWILCSKIRRIPKDRIFLGSKVLRSTNPQWHLAVSIVVGFVFSMVT